MYEQSLHQFCLANNLNHILQEWHPTLNSTLTPETVTPGTRKKMWWRCKKGHEWKATVKSRTLDKAGCPVCAHRQIIVGENDLATTDPDIAKEWHPTKNGNLKPQDVFAGSDRKVWWECELGHEWEAAIGSRRQCGCPYCTGKKVLVGFNDLATLYPEIAEQWHPELNGEMRPDHVTPSSNRKAWWLCEKGHVWEAVIASRAAKGYGCTYCTNRRVLPGFNDIKTTAPRIAEQWHPTMNGDLTPEMVTKGSKKKVWWICQEGHVWKTVVYSRCAKQQTGCPVCSGRYKIKNPE